MNKIKKNVKRDFTQIANENPPKIVEAKIIEEKELLPENKEIIVVKEFAKPLITAEEATKAFAQYQALMGALMKESDIVEIQGKKKIKKSGINKIARFFGVSVEVIRHHREETIGPQGGKNFVWYVWTRATLPTGQSRVEGAACSSSERRFAHLENDVLTTAITRSSKRAVENLVGMGEYEMIEEESNGRKVEDQIPEQPTEQKPKETEQPNNNSETIERKVNEDITEVGIKPDDWRPLYKSKPVKYGGGYPSNPNMEASGKQMDFIAAAVKKLGIVPEEAIFILNNRADGLPREKMIIDLLKSDASDIISTIIKGKDELLKLIKK